MEQNPYRTNRVRWNRVIGALLLLLAAGLLGWHYWQEHQLTDQPTDPANERSESVQAAETDEACLNQAPTRRNVLQEIRQRGLKVAVESDAPPFNQQVNGKPTGFDYEIAREIAKRIGVSKVDMVYASGDDYGILPCYLHDKRADWFMGGYVPTAKFDKLVAWSDSYYPQNGYCLIVKKGSGIKGVSDLKGKKVGVYDEDAVEKWVRETAQAMPVRFTDAGQVSGRDFAAADQDKGKWMLLATKSSQDNGYDMDAIVYDYPFAAAELKNCEGKLKIVQYNLSELPYSIGLPSENEDLLDAVNKALRELKESPVYAELIRRFIPRAEGEVVSVPTPRANVKQHTVKSGETLSGIVAAELGDIALWPKVWEWNKNRIPNPHLISPGDVIVLADPG